MTELTVKYRYRQRFGLSNSTAGLMKLSFPLWGIILPLAAILGTILTPILWMEPLMRSFAASATSLTIVCMAISLICLRFNKLLSKDFLAVDKGCIELPDPISLGFGSRRVSWTSVDKIQVVYRSQSNKISDAQLTFFIRNEPPIPIECEQLTTVELEQLLLAIQLWAPASALEESVLQLQTEIKNTALLQENGNDPSYTALWEEELRRRFRQVAFLPLEPGRILRNGSLKVVRQLAMGGLAAIYLCQLDNRNLVVVKEAVTPEDSPPELKAKAEELFHREAQLLMRLSHPNIVRVLDYFVEAGRSYLMLEYVNGASLRQHVKQNGRIRESVVIDWGMQVAEVMKYLHEQEPPIIHRDLTPDNIVMRADGKLVVIDFGAANEFIGNSTGTFVGKQCFIPPEQFRGKATPQSDIYAFGGTLYFLLTSEDPEALRIGRPRQKNETVSAALDGLVANCMEPQLEKRVATAQELINLFKSVSASPSTRSVV